MKLQEFTSSAHNFEECMKCTVCTAYCPVVQVNPRYPGPKQAGPDGERLRLKDPIFFDEALKYCLNCKRCEVACPSGVNVADIIQEARMKYGKSKPRLRDRILASTDVMGPLVVPFAPVVNFVTGLGVTKAVLHATMGIDRHRTFPKYSSRTFEAWFRRNALKEQRKYDNKVAFFHGCYVNYNYPALGKDFVKIMNAIGYGVELLDKEQCCGVAMISNGMYDGAVKHARNNVSALSKAVDKGLKILTTSSTCTFTMRDEYPDVLGLQNSDVRDNIMLATKWLYEKISSGEVKLKFRKDFRMKVVYHTACHMQKMGWQLYSIELLRMIPGLTLTVLDQNCCGISGTFGFKKENYGFSQKIGSKLFEDIRTSNPEYVATDCETCKWQIEMSTGIPVLNPIEILAEAIEL